MREKVVIFVSSQKRYLKCVRTPSGWKIYYKGDPAFVKLIRSLPRRKKIELCKRLSVLIQKSVHREIEKVEREVERELRKLRKLFKV